ncbi:MAG TPA: amidase [Burkholderiales bacterium]|nr:amidase [Burkholderiales bacterium]
MSDPALLSLAQAREVPHRELVQACRARIEHWQPRINAFVEVAESRTKGVPLAHKDRFYRAGREAACGSKILRGWVAGETSAALERLDAAGFADLGRLNMSEFAYGPTGHNEHFGDCRNPWNPDYITGGSSSGSGAAVAARLVFGALGSDTGGSVRLPAAACGITGLKTTWGRVSRHGAMPLSHSLDTVGPLARSAEDCAILLQAIAGFDARDPQTSREPVDDYLQEKNKIRIAISSTWIERNAEPEVAAAVLAAAGLLDKNPIEVEPPDFETLSAHCLVVMQAEASAQHAKWMRERPGDYSSSVRARLESGYAIPASQYLEVLRLRRAALDRFCAQTLGAADVYVVPGIAIRLPTREETGPKGGERMPRLLADLSRLTRWVNYLGVPALALPCGFDSRGMPLSLQLVARPFAEATLLAAGQAYQRATDWHCRAPA